MGRKALEYFGGLIALYLVVAHAADAGKVITAGANGVNTVTKGLQGR